MGPVAHNTKQQWAGVTLIVTSSFLKRSVLHVHTETRVFENPHWKTAFTCGQEEQLQKKYVLQISALVWTRYKS